MSAVRVSSICCAIPQGGLLSEVRGNTCIANLLLGVYRNLLEHVNFPIFFLIGASSQSTGESVHWQKLN